MLRTDRMILTIRIDASALRRWHLDLVERLSALDGVQPLVELADGRRERDLAPWLRIEGLLRGQPAREPLRSLPADAFCAWRGADGASELVLDLTAQGAPSARRCWRLLFDGEPGEARLVAAVLAGRTPVVEIKDGTETIAAARIGTDRGDAAQTAVDDMLERVVTLCVAAVRGGRPALPRLPPSTDQPAPALSITWAASRLARGLLRGAAGAAYRRLYRTPHWRVGWRRLDGPDLFDLKRHPEGGWRDLPDDGARFYADPFPILHDGRVTLFVEDFAHDLGKGIISAVEFGADGPLGVPEPVLELPEHLSYPHVFARDGEVWMVPECGQSGRIDLYRATAFPGGWVREATLARDVVASDATLVEHDGRWWMFATVRDGGGFSDALHVWSAPDFRGPWMAHPKNPVLIDIASARPAGAMVRRGGALLRPVQDCRRGYGKALGLARVLRLDEEGFEQEMEAIVEAGSAQWPGRRIHSLNSAGGFEFIDGSAEARRRLPWER
jgi:hypothetical protein